MSVAAQKEEQQSEPIIKHTQYERPQSPSLWFGVALAACVGLMALFLGRQLPTIGGPVFAILLGLLIRNTFGVLPVFRPGLQFSSKSILQWSIIFLGFGLSFGQVVTTGIDSIVVTIGTIVAAFVSAFLLGKVLGVQDKIRSLIGIGTAICGGSAIAALAPIIKPKEHETALAVSTIFLFNVVAVLTFPFFGHFFHMSDIGFGLWAGTAINDTSSVVAAAYSFSNAAGDYATIVKLTRATFIIPICLFYVVWQLIQQKKSSEKVSIQRLIPWFIIYFVGASLIRSSDILPADLLLFLSYCAHFLMVLALAAIGLSTDMRMLVRTGWQPLALGLGTWAAVVTTSLVIQLVMGKW